MIYAGFKEPTYGNMVIGSSTGTGNVGNFVIGVKTNDHEGSCFSVKKDDNPCFSIKASQDQCFFINYNEEAKDYLDFAKDFSKIRAVHFQSTDELFAVVQKRNDDTSWFITKILLNSKGYSILDYVDVTSILGTYVHPIFLSGYDNKTIGDIVLHVDNGNTMYFYSSVTLVYKGSATSPEPTSWRAVVGGWYDMNTRFWQPVIDGTVSGCGGESTDNYVFEVIDTYATTSISDIPSKIDYGNENGLDIKATFDIGEDSKRLVLASYNGNVRIYKEAEIRDNYLSGGYCQHKWFNLSTYFDTNVWYEQYFLHGGYLWDGKYVGFYSKGFEDEASYYVVDVENNIIYVMPDEFQDGMTDWTLQNGIVLVSYNTSRIKRWNPLT